LLSKRLVARLCLHPSSIARQCKRTTQTSLHQCPEPVLAGASTATAKMQAAARVVAAAAGVVVAAVVVMVVVVVVVVVVGGGRWAVGGGR
jgi:hypothetical protein